MTACFQQANQTCPQGYKRPIAASRRSTAPSIWGQLRRRQEGLQGSQALSRRQHGPLPDHPVSGRHGHHPALIRASRLARETRILAGPSLVSPRTSLLCHPEYVCWAASCCPAAPCCRSPPPSANSLRQSRSATLPDRVRRARGVPATGALELPHGYQQVDRSKRTITTHQMSMGVADPVTGFRPGFPRPAPSPPTCCWCSAPAHRHSPIRLDADEKGPAGPFSVITATQPVASACWRASSSLISSRILNFCSLPVTVMGYSSTNRMYLGTLK